MDSASKQCYMYSFCLKTFTLVIDSGSAFCTVNPGSTVWKSSTLTLREEVSAFVKISKCRHSIRQIGNFIFGYYSLGLNQRGRAFIEFCPIELQPFYVNKASIVICWSRSHLVFG